MGRRVHWLHHDARHASVDVSCSRNVFCPLLFSSLHDGQPWPVACVYSVCCCKRIGADRDMAQAAHGVHCLTGMYAVNFANYFDIAANPNVALDKCKECRQKTH